jgi:hypothetical protein
MSGRDKPWRPGNQRDTVATIIAAAALALTQAARRTLEPGAVIGCEQDHRIAVELAGLELGEQATDDIVDLFDHVAIGADAGMSMEGLVGILRQMRRAQRQLDEERPGRVRVDETLRFGIEALLKLGQVGLLFPHRAGTVNRVQRQWCHVVAVGNAEEIVETVCGRGPVIAGMTEMPFAEQAGYIAGGLECLRDGHLGLRQNARVVLHDDLVAEAGTDRIAPGQQPGT